jgi:hypothetical protein
MTDVDWSALHKILSDPTRRLIIELLAEKAEFSYTEIMAELRISNTGRLNYHLKALNSLLSKDDQGKYRLTEKGKLAANMLKTFPNKVHAEKDRKKVKVRTAALLIVMGAVLFFTAFSFPFYAATTNPSDEQPLTFSDLSIDQNSTLRLMELIAPQKGAQFNIVWTASNHMNIYVMNYDQLLVFETQNNMCSLSANLTGMPDTYLYKYVLQDNSTSFTLPQGFYYLYVGSVNATSLDSLSLSELQPYRIALSATSIGVISVLLAVGGVVLTVLGILIVKHHVWR